MLSLFSATLLLQKILFRILAALLPAAIQSIDINNIMKTAAALKFIYAVLSSLHVGYESDTVPSGDECLIARYEVNSYIADWPIQLCDRLLSYVRLIYYFLPIHFGNDQSHIHF